MTSVHLTESCDEDAPRLITQVETSREGLGDVDVTPVIHQGLKDKDLLPREHLTDTNYAQAKQFVQSHQQYGIDLIAPTRADHKWQAKEKQGFDAASFPVDWDAQKVSCPAGRDSSSWTPTIDQYGNQVIRIKFSLKDCKPCQRKRALHQSPPPGPLHPRQGTPSSLTSRQSTSKGPGVLGEISQPIRDRGHYLPRGASLWPASQSLSKHAENSFAAPGECGGDQPGANPGMVK